MRPFRVINKSGCLRNTYIDEGAEYFLVSMDQTVCFRPVIPKSWRFGFMPYGKFKEALRNNLIQFTD